MRRPGPITSVHIPQPTSHQDPTGIRSESSIPLKFPPDYHESLSRIYFIYIALTHEVILLAGFRHLPCLSRFRPCTWGPPHPHRKTTPFIDDSKNTVARGPAHQRKPFDLIDLRYVQIGPSRLAVVPIFGTVPSATERAIN